MLMSLNQSLDVLNNLALIHSHSLPKYLSYAVPWSHDEDAIQCLRYITEAHDNMAERIQRLIADRRGLVQAGEFPLHYTGYHDLSFKFVLPHVVRQQHAAIRIIDQAAQDLENLMAKEKERFLLPWPRKPWAKQRAI